MAIKLANDPNLTDQKAKQETGETKQEIKDTGNFLLRRAENFGVLFDNETGFFRGKDRDGNFILQDGKPFNPLN
jgi:putative alpha-1,2-mannosidase